MPNRVTGDAGPVLVVGGAGFIGSNLVDHLARRGHRVRVFDDLSRAGADQNLTWLRRRHGDQVQPLVANVRHRGRLRDAVDGVQAVFHLASPSVWVPELGAHDPATVGGGVVELLEAVRRCNPLPAVIVASSGEVYGALSHVPMVVEGERWWPADAALRATGLDEGHPLAFETPAGAARAAVDQYVLDHARMGTPPAVILRLGCVYGPRQDHGWVAQFVTRAIDDKPITICGDGREVRDVLYVEDAVDALERAWLRADVLAGRAFNVGGGPGSTLSRRELVAMIEELRGRTPSVVHRDAGAGEPRCYVSDARAFARATEWRPRIGPRAGVTALLGWLLDQRTGRPQTLENLDRIPVASV